MEKPHSKAWAILLHDGDDVAVMATAGIAGQQCEIRGAAAPTAFILATDVPFAHKVSLKDMKIGDIVSKFGCPIAQMSADASIGSHIHIHNAQGARAALRGVK